MSAGDPADPLLALIAFLKADSTIDDLTNGRVFGVELPEKDTATSFAIENMPIGAIVLRPSGGAQLIGNAYQRFGDGRVDVVCYGAKPRSARTLYLAAHGALKHLKRSTWAECVLHWARPAGGPLSLRDPDTEWPFTLSVWQVLANELAVA